MEAEAAGPQPARAGTSPLAAGPPSDRARIGAVSEPEEHGSLIDFLNVVLRHRWMVLSVVIPILAIALVAGLLQERTFSSTSTFISQGQSSPSGVSGLASQLGIALPPGGPSDNPAFSADLVKSRTILEAAALAQYSGNANGRRVTQSLIQIYGLEGGSPQSQLDRAVKRLVRDVSVSLNQRTAVVSVRVAAPSASLAQAVNQRLLDLLNDFNLHNRQSQARQERVFSEQRLAEVSSDLRAAEDRLEGFLEANRNYQSSPTLSFQYQRLSRVVSDQQSLHATILQAFERSKMDEVRDIPVITIVDKPSLPARANSRLVVLVKVLFWVLLGLAIGIGLALVKARVSRHRGNASPEFREFERLASEFTREFSWPFRRVKSLFFRG